MSGPISFRAAESDPLDRMVRVAPPLAWVALAIFLAILAGGLVWSVASTAPVKVGGRGVLQADGGLMLIAAPDGGILESLLVGVGDRVTAGMPVGRIAQPGLLARRDGVGRRIALLGAERDRLAAFHDRERAVHDAADDRRRAGLERTLDALRGQEAAQRQSIANQHELRSRGYATRDRVLALEAELAEIRQRIAAAQDALGLIVVEASRRQVVAERDLLEADNRVAAARRDLAEVEVDLAARSEIRAAAAGRVLEVSATVGEQVTAGAPLLRLSGAQGGGLAALLYVPAGEGKRVRPGMAVQVVPSTVRMAREGFILAEVETVSEIPATREAVLHTLKNAALTDALLSEGPPFEVRLRLRSDPATVSGFAWSSDLGGTRAVEAGTIFAGHVVVDRIRLLSLVFPKVDTLFHWLGLDP